MELKYGIKVDKIKTFINDNVLTKKEFCKRCGIGIKTLNKILNGQDNVRVIAIYKITIVMGINMSQIYC